MQNDGIDVVSKQKQKLIQNLNKLWYMIPYGVDRCSVFADNMTLLRKKLIEYLKKP